MSIDLLANLAYILAAALFIFGLKMLGSPATAKRGNLLSSTAMFIAVVSGRISAEVVSYEFIIGGMIVGATVGALAARLVAVTTTSSRWAWTGLDTSGSSATPSAAASGVR